MSFRYPALLVVAVAVVLGLVVAYRLVQRRRTSALAAAGLSTASPGRARLRRHLPPLLFLAALTLLLIGVARPQATVAVPRVAGTVILAFDVSNSMAAKDVTPTRLAAAQSAAIGFVRAQPDTVDIGVVAFGQGALTTQLPTNDHEGTVAAINRLTVAGGTSLGQAILASLAAIVGQPVSLPDPSSDVPPPDLGYWGSATIVLLSDGEDTGRARRCRRRRTGRHRRSTHRDHRGRHDRGHHHRGRRLPAGDGPGRGAADPGRRDDDRLLSPSRGRGRPRRHPPIARSAESPPED